MTGRARPVTALALALATALGGCGRDGGELPACCRAPASAPDGAWVRSTQRHGERRTVVCADGSRFDVPAAPRRVVSTLPSITELVAHLVGLEVLVGVSRHCNVPPGVERLPRVEVMPVDVEGLRSLSPDLVLCDRVLHAGSLALLERHAASVLPLESRSLAHLAATIDVLAEVFDRPEVHARAATLKAALASAERAAVRARREPPLRVLLVGQPDPLHVLGPGSLLDDLLRACGAVNAACDLGRPSGPFSEEAVLLRAPDWILTTGDPLPAAFRQRWARVPAVAHGSVASVRADDLLRAGPRTPDALDRLAAVLAGELGPERLAEPAR